MPTYPVPDNQLASPLRAGQQPADTAPNLAAMRQARRAWWLKQLHQWHWVSSALCLVGMLLFAVTGITLNHAGQIEARPDTTVETRRLPPLELDLLKNAARDAVDGTLLPPSIRHWLAEELGRSIPDLGPEWSDDEIYLALPRPGGDAWLSIDLASGELEYELTDRGWVAWLNDLHKGRNTGTAWSWFIDLFAAACLVFCLTGLFILQMHARNRPMVWPMVGLGTVVPVLLIILFIH